MAKAAHKTHGLKAHSVDTTSGAISPARVAKPAYSASTPEAAPPPAASGVSQAGQKALALRAKKVLTAVSDPNQSITE